MSLNDSTGVDAVRTTGPALPVQVVAVTSGKGGVGKTSLAVNLSVALAQGNRRVMLMDADLGLANVDVQLGLKIENDLQDVLRGRRTLQEIILPGPGGLKVVPASSGVKELAELGTSESFGVIHAFSDLDDPLDVLVIDTATGISESVVNFSRASQEVMVVVCDDPASIRDSSALIRLLNQDYGIQRFRILVNMTHAAQEGYELFNRVNLAVHDCLDLRLAYLGSVPYDEKLRMSVHQHRAVVEAYPHSRSAMAIRNIANVIGGWPVQGRPAGHLEFFVERMVQPGCA